MMKFYVELGRKRSFAFAGAAAAAQPHGSHNPYCVLAAKRFRSLRRTRSHTLSVAAMNIPTFEIEFCETLR